MPFDSTNRVRPRRLGLVSGAAAVAAVLAGIPAATAAGTTSEQPTGRPAPEATAGALTDLTGGRYVVLLRQPSATRHTASRSPNAGFNARSRGVQDYAESLRATQRAVAGSVGARIDMSYTIASNGFSAQLTARQAFELSSDRRVMLVQRDQVVHADTWHTPRFLGLTGESGAWNKAGGRKQAGAGIVVADLDSGIWPESKSFAGRPLTETPRTRWEITRTGTATRMEKADGAVFNGTCELGEEWAADDCNTKLIGARYYSEGLSDVGLDLLDADYVSPRDGNGHGTHTAGTAAGKVVHDVSTEGVRFGTISGMAPAARLAVYKVLWQQQDGTASGAISDIAAAIEDAVVDGVDVINLSVSGATDTALDSTEIALAGAAEAGIFVSASAGNDGPDRSTVAHNSPWLTTVAASTHHTFQNTLVLGSGRKIVGASVNDRPVGSTRLVTSRAAAVAGGDASDAALCGPDTLDPAEVAGTIVVCTRGVYDRVAKSAEVARAGGAAMVLANAHQGESLDADYHSVPTVHIDVSDAEKVFDYIDARGSTAIARIELGNRTRKRTPIPQIGSFSARGPAVANEGDLLKPDITAPGVDVLAAVAPPSNSGRDYDLYSGTSMAAPHVSGLAAFMLGVHPQWSPMMIKSAMMTTAQPVKKPNGSRSRNWFAQGAGLVTPKRFFTPGLFITSTPEDWLGFMAGQGLDTGVPALAAKDLNGPSMADGEVTSSATFRRAFTAQMKGRWRISADVPGYSVRLSSRSLLTTRKGDMREVSFTFTRTTAPLLEWGKGLVTLTGPTTVRIPVVLRPVAVAAPDVVRGTGRSGSTEVPITGGVTGDLTVDISGLDQAQADLGSVASEQLDLLCIPVAGNSDLARFDLDAADDSADLDLFVLHSTSCDPADADALAGESATDSADESVTLLDPAAGSYLVEIAGYAAGQAGSPMRYELRSFDVNPTSNAGDLTVTPNPVPVAGNRATSFDLSWSGLSASSHYLGLLRYEGALAPTVVEVEP